MSFRPRIGLSAATLSLAMLGCSSSSGGEAVVDSGEPSPDTSVSDGIAVDTSTTDGADEGIDTAIPDTKVAKDTAVRDTESPGIDTSPADTAPPPGACNALTPAAFAPYHRTTDASPIATGGTLLDGDYALVDFIEYGAPVTETFALHWISERYVITGSTLQAVVQASASSKPEWLSMTVTTAGTSYKLAKTCGVGDPETGLTYTASDTELSIFDHFAGHDRRYVMKRTPPP